MSANLLCAGIGQAQDLQAPVLHSETYETYTADPSESYVVETSESQMSETMPSAWENARPAAVTCQAYYPAIVGSASRSDAGTLCEQSDGSLRMVTAPMG